MAGQAQGAGALLVGDRLACRRGERLIFSGLALTLAAGDLLVLRGPNGSGKSSLLRLLAALIEPEQGSLVWRGQEVAADPEAFRSELSYLGHLDAIKPELTPREDIRFWLRLRGQGAGTRERAEASLAALGLDRVAALPCRLLSAGQRRRLAMARIIAAGTRLWLLDEPFTGLDETGIEATKRLIEAHRRSGGLAVIALHGPADFANAGSLDLGALASGDPGIDT